MTIKANRALAEVLHSAIALSFEHLFLIVSPIQWRIGLVEDVVLSALQEVFKATLMVQVDHQLAL